MKGASDEGKEINPMFPRLHIKDEEKEGPKAPPRNKMALYEKLCIPAPGFDSGSASLFPLPLRNDRPGPSSSRHVDSSHNIQFGNSSTPTYPAEKIHVYHSGVVHLNKLMPDDFLYCKNSLKIFDGEDALITHDSSRRNSFCSISQNIKDEDRLKSQYSFRKKVNTNGSIELKSAKYGKNQIEKHSEVSQIVQKPEEGSAHPLVGFGDGIGVSSISPVEIRNVEGMKKAHSSLKEEIRSISENSLKILQGSNRQTNGEHATLGDKINFRDGYLEKPAVTDVHKCPGGLDFNRKCFQGKSDRHKDADIYRPYDASNKPISDSILGMNISPDVLGVLGGKKFWKTRRTLINQQRIFLVQVFELHRLIQVQRLITGSPRLLLEENLLLSKPSPNVSALKKLQSDFVTEQPSSNIKLNSKSMKPATERADNNAVGKTSLFCVNNMSKGPVIQLPNYGHHSENRLPAPTATNTKQSPACIYPPPGNQWLVPVMTPSEGLVYKPFIGPCPPNAGFMAPVYGACGPMSLNHGNKDVSDAGHAVPASHQGIGILSGTPLSQLFPPCGPSIMHPSISASAVEQVTPSDKMQSKGPESQKSDGYTILYQSSCNMSNQTSEVKSKHVTNFLSSKDLQLKSSTASNPSKRMREEVLTLFPAAPTFWASADRNSQVVDNQPRPQVIKAKPHNPKSATESAARIFRSIQEERKHL